MANRFIEEEALRRTIRSVLSSANPDRQAVFAAIDRYLARQPRAPRLVGTTAAARILGIKPPHVTRLREQGRMPEPIDVEGSVDVYVRDEVEDLGRELHAERAARAQRRAEREEAAT